MKEVNVYILALCAQLAAARLVSNVIKGYLD
jgi:hypothetical protein